ncbi:head GIN domain-containing protein [Dysgonomonas capnocytophagoides]|uniref:head GIN domain-containing protein n=1 Tax=Dysgonomonas capnocytophagoides TaxID=45254 RepID=UPI0039932417
MKTTIRTIVYSCCFAVLALASCKGKAVEGDGNVIAHEIPVDIYSEIRVEGAFDVIYEAKPDEAAYLRVEADDNIIPLVDIKTKGRSLNIKARESINPSRFVVCTNSPSLKYIESKGASNVTLKGSIAGSELKIEMKGVGDLNAENLIYEKSEFKLQGANELNLAGQCHKAKFELSGTGDIKASGLAVDELECNLKGSGNMEVNALEKLSIEIKGKGEIAYKGNPQITKQKIKGAGSVRVL